MNTQMNIPGVRPVRAPVPAGRLCELSRLLGSLVGIGDVVDELKRVQKELPSVPGLTLALSVAEKHLAQAQLKNSRLVLILASSAGLEVERMATTVELRDDGGLDLVTFSSSDADQKDGVA